MDIKTNHAKALKALEAALQDPERDDETSWGVLKVALRHHLGADDDQLKAITVKILYTEGEFIVRSVNGQKVRRDINIDFVSGGHYLVYDYIPEKELWIDSELPPQEEDFIAIHEVHECYLMQSGMKYDDAHEQASKIEHYYRETPKGLKEKIKEELKRIAGTENMKSLKNAIAMLADDIDITEASTCGLIVAGILAHKIRSIFMPVGGKKVPPTQAFLDFIANPEEMTKKQLENAVSSIVTYEFDIPNEKFNEISDQLDKYQTPKSIKNIQEQYETATATPPATVVNDESTAAPPAEEVWNWQVLNFLDPQGKLFELSAGPAVGGYSVVVRYKHLVSSYEDPQVFDSWEEALKYIPEGSYPIQLPTVTAPPVIG